jgi:M6 family metalloprotease-like protein
MKIWITFLLTLLFLQGCGEAPSSSTANPAPIITQLSRDLLVVQLSYNDIEFTDSDPSIWSHLIFGNKEGQLNHFYAEISQNQFSFLPVSETNGDFNDGIMSIKLNKNHPNPGNNFTLLHPDFKDALTQLDKDIDFSQYDINSNGAISSEELLIIFIVAGNEEAYGPDSLPGVFAHQYNISNTNNIPKLDGVSLMSNSGKGNYAVFGERHNHNRRNATIGIIAHELGHAAFGLPDLYDTSPSDEPDSAGIGYFGLMGSGMWAANTFGEPEGSSPTHMCAWSKIKNGWVSPEVFNDTTPSHINLTETYSDNFNVIKIPINDRQYYLLENRNKSGYDRGLYSVDGVFKGGLALWKIDENIINSKMLSNSVNSDKNSKGIDLIEATHESLDISAFEHGHEKNLFYLGNRNNYSDSFIVIESISSRGEVMSATIKDKQ